MVHHLLVPLAEHIESLAILRSVTFRALCAGIAAFLVCFIVGPGLIDHLRAMKVGEVIRSGSERLEREAQAKAGTPTMGGMIFVLATAVATLLFARIDLTIVQAPLWATVALAVLGGADDRIKLLRLPDPDNPGRTLKGMSGRGKILGQLVIGAVAVIWLWSDLRHVPGWAESWLGMEFAGHPGWVAAADALGGFAPWLVLAGLVAFGLLVTVATTNSVNLTDGMDGLAAGCGVFVLLTMTLVAYLVGHVEAADHLGLVYVAGAEELAVFLAALTGATGGFLWWNAHPAKVFMGDTGSLALGGALAVSAVAMRQELLLVVAGAAFAWESLSVIIQVWSFRTRGRRVFRCAPFHHHLQFGGWSESRIVMTFWVGSAVCCVVALGLMRIV